MIIRRRALSTLIAFIMLVSVIFPVSAFATTRLGGEDRFLTAIQVAETGWPTGSDNVVLVTAYSFSDAAAAVPLAKKLNAPVLLTDAKALNAATLKEIQKLNAKKITIIGGQAAISASVETELIKVGYNENDIKRYGGTTAIDTAALIAGEFGSASKGVVVSINGLPDALTVASWAAAQGIPVLYTDKDTLSPVTKNALTKAGVTSTIVIGGEAVVSKAVFDVLPNPVRYGGQDRYETAAMVAANLQPEAEMVYVASGLTLVDAMIGANLAAKTNSPMIYVDNGVPGYVTEYLETVKTIVKDINIIGGNGIISYSQKVLLLSAISPENPDTVLTKAVADYYTNMGSESYKISEAALKEGLEKIPNDYVVLDIRRADAYAKGHIKGAINVPYGPGIAKNLEKIRAVANGKTLIVACYTGQTAGQADSLLNLAGIKTRSLHGGMSTDGFEMGWQSKAYPVVIEPTLMPEVPAVASPNKIIDDAVKEYFENMPSDSYKIGLPEMKLALETNADQYFIVDIRSAADFAKGHIKGATNVPFAEVGKNLNLLKEKSKGKITVVYCYTGQTAGQTDSLMNVIGINTKSLNFGFGTATFKRGWSGQAGYEIVIDKEAVLTKAVADYYTNMGSESYKISEASLNEELVKNPNNYVVLDIRRADAYAKGHIKGAINVPYGAGIATNLEKIRAVANGKTLVVACYTGQTAGQADSLLNLAGIKTRSLNGGMSTDGFEMGWQSKAYPVVTEPTLMPDAPAVASPNQIIDDAVKAYFENMPSDSYKIGLPEMKLALETNADQYFIVDIRSAADFAKGHIKGAINVPFALVGQNLSMLKEKSKGKITVVYCYTGQTAGQTDSLMNVIGINTKSLNFGFGTATFTRGWSGQAGYEIVTE